MSESGDKAERNAEIGDELDDLPPEPPPPEPTDILEQLDRTAKSVRECLWQLEDPMMGIRVDEEAYDQLPYCLRRLYTETLVALDHMGLNASRAALDEFWHSFQTSGLKKDLKFYPDPGVVGSTFYDHLDAVISAIRILKRTGPSHAAVIEQQDLQRLENFLRQIPSIVRKRSMLPDRERHIKELAEEFLSEFFVGDYCREFAIPGVVKNFRPDAGILSLKTVIEFKFIDSEDEFKQATSGLFEDSVGYKGSSDWTRYFSLLYQTDAFGTERQLESEFQLKALVNWKPILVTGPGRRKTR